MREVVVLEAMTIPAIAVQAMTTYAMTTFVSGSRKSSSSRSDRNCACTWVGKWLPFEISSVQKIPGGLMMLATVHVIVD